MSAAVASEATAGRKRGRRLGFLRYRSGQVGFALLAFILLIAFLGPFFAPDSPSAIVGVPFSKPNGSELQAPTSSGATFSAASWQEVAP